jgi:hypothetical protein
MCAPCLRAQVRRGCVTAASQRLAARVNPLLHFLQHGITKAACRSATVCSPGGCALITV